MDGSDAGTDRAVYVDGGAGAGVGNYSAGVGGATAGDGVVAGCDGEWKDGGLFAGYSVSSRAGGGGDCVGAGDCPDAADGGAVSGAFW